MTRHQQEAARHRRWNASCGWACRRR